MTIRNRIDSSVSAPFYSIEFPSSIEAMRAPLNGAIAALTARGWVDKDHPFYARLCLEEAVVNAITHGNQCDERRLVRVEMIEENDFCTILVYDQGPGFVLEQVPFPNGAAQRGRGICLIRHCMDEVIYDTERHCLVMKIRRKTHNKGVRDHE